MYQSASVKKTLRSSRLMMRRSCSSLQILPWHSWVSWQGLSLHPSAPTSFFQAPGSIFPARQLCHWDTLSKELPTALGEAVTVLKYRGSIPKWMAPLLPESGPTHNQLMAISHHCVSPHRPKLCLSPDLQDLRMWTYLEIKSLEMQLVKMRS